MNHHDADKLLALLSGYPAATVEKAEELIAESQAAHAAYSAASDAAHEAQKLWIESQRARLHNRQVSVAMTGPGGAPEYEADGEPDATWLKPIAAELQRKWRDWKRQRDAADRLAIRWQDYGFLGEIDGWLNERRHEKPGTRVKLPAAKLRKGETHTDAVARIRVDIEAINARYAQAETAVATVQELVGRMDREIDELAARGAVSPSLTNREGPVVNLTGDGVRSFDHGLVGLLPETIVWILAPQVKNALAEKIRSAHPGGGLTDFERAAELAALERERLELERLEESHIIAAAEIGQHIARRRDADPRAILEIE